MRSKILTVLSIAALCSGEPPSEPHSPPKHATSSQSYTREDVPLSYKHSAVHIYTTQKPQPYKYQAPHDAAPQNHQIDYQSQDHLYPAQYQYAPIPIQGHKKEKLYTRVSAPQPNDEVEQKYERIHTQNYADSSPEVSTAQEQYVSHGYVAQNRQPYGKPEYSAPAYPVHKVAEPSSAELQKPSVPNHQQHYVNVAHEYRATSERPSYTNYEIKPTPDKKTVTVYAVMPSNYIKPSANLYQHVEAAPAPAKPVQPSSRTVLYVNVLGRPNAYLSNPFHGGHAQRAPSAHYYKEIKPYHRNSESNQQPTNYLYSIQKPSEHSYHLSQFS